MPPREGEERAAPEATNKNKKVCVLVLGGVCAARRGVCAGAGRGVFVVLGEVCFLLGYLHIVFAFCSSLSS